MDTTHQLDHLVMPTGSLAVARERLTCLGFTVAPDGVHPFGTENCCVYLSDGTFMEPIAVADPPEISKAIDLGNVFVARDHIYREYRGDEGFSAVVFGTDDAAADHAHYGEAGISAGNMLEFSRPFVDAGGKKDNAAFRLAFAARAMSRDAFVFACQRLNAPKVDRSALQAHANGVHAIAEVIAVADDPAAALRFLATAAGRGTAVHGGSILLPNARLTVLAHAAFTARYAGVVDTTSSALRFIAVVFSVANLEKTRMLLAENRVTHDMRTSGIVVAPAGGQGAAFIFEETA